MAVEHSKVATQVKCLELMLEEVKQMLARDKHEPSSFLRFKGTLKGWLNADEELLADCRLKFDDLCQEN